MFCAVGAIGLLGLDRLILSPLMNLWKERAERIEQVESRLANGNALISQERAYRRKWREMQRDSLGAASSEAESKVIKAVDAWADESRLGFTGLKPSWRELDSELGRLLECRASGFGDLRNVARFLYELEADSLPLRIEDLELISRDERGERLNLSVRFTGLQLSEGEETE